MRIKIMFPFSTPWREYREQIPRDPRGSVDDWYRIRRVPPPPWPLLERPIIKVMATFQVDFRVARSERSPPDQPITVTKGLAVLPFPPPISLLGLLSVFLPLLLWCVPGGDCFQPLRRSLSLSPSIIAYTHRWFSIDIAVISLCRASDSLSFSSL